MKTTKVKMNDLMKGEILIGALLMVIFLVCLTATVATAEPVDSIQMAKALPVTNQAQAAVKDLIEKGLYKEALSQWDPAFDRSEFSKSPSGKAFLSLLLFRNNIPVISFESLMSIENPENINLNIRNIWASELPSNHEIWRLDGEKWSSRWAKVFPTLPGLATVNDTQAAWKIKGLKTENDFKNAEALLKKLDTDGSAAAWIRWQLALGRAALSQNASAGFYLQEILDSKQTFIQKDRVLLATARIFFQNQKFDLALKYYNMVSKSSDYWLEAVEEKAWVSIRLKKYEEALSQVKTLTSPLFVTQVGPEPYYLAGVAEIKICDYFGAFKILKDFKQRFGERLPELQNLSKSGSTLSSLRAMNLLDDGKNPLNLAGDLGKLPRLFYRDDLISRSSRTAQSLKQEVAILAQWNRPELPTLVSLLNLAKGRYELEHTRFQSRMKILAQIEIKDFSIILQKLHVVEIEAIQRMYPNPSQKLALNSKITTASSVKSNDTLIFPEDGEVWMDEVDHYHVNAKGCPQRAEGKTL